MVAIVTIFTDKLFPNLRGLDFLQVVEIFYSSMSFASKLGEFSLKAWLLVVIVEDDAIMRETSFLRHYFYSQQTWSRGVFSGYYAEELKEKPLGLLFALLSCFA